jgi:amino acid transporter
MLLSLINLGSAVALNIVTSLGTGALICSYVVSISCIIIKRLRGEQLLPRRWSLGAWGLPINIFSVLFLVLVFIMNFFPISPQGLTPATFNWNILIVSLCPCHGFLVTELTMTQFSSALLSLLPAYITQCTAGRYTPDLSPMCGRRYRTSAFSCFQWLCVASILSV